MNLKNCHNVEDFRKLAKKKLPSPIFHYIDGGSDDEVTLRRNTDSYFILIISGEKENRLVNLQTSDVKRYFISSSISSGIVFNEVSFKSNGIAYFNLY